MVRIRYSHRSLKNEALKSRAEFHYEKMNGNPTYAAYQPLITELGALFAPFITAIANFKLGGRDRTDIKNKIQADIIAVLNALGRKMEDGANLPGLNQAAGEAFVKGAGFDLVDARNTTPKKVITFLDAPTGLKATDEKKQGCCNLDFDENDDAITYLIECSSNDVDWKIYGVTDSSPILLTGFPSKANISVRLTGISYGTVMSDKSEPVTVWVS